MDKAANTVGRDECMLIIGMPRKPCSLSMHQDVRVQATLTELLQHIQNQFVKDGIFSIII